MGHYVKTRAGRDAQMIKPREDEARGTVYGNWMVIGYAMSRPMYVGGALARMLCVVCKCGNLCIKSKSNVKHGKTNSCGCASRSLALGKENFGWKGSEQISGHYFGKIRLGAKHRGLAFEIDVHDMQSKLDEQGCMCALTGLALELPTAVRQIGTASLDRIDSSKGYVPGNIRFVHKLVNQAKMDSTDKDFIRMCTLVALKAGTVRPL